MNETTGVKQTRPTYYYTLWGLLTAVVVIAVVLVALVSYRAEKKMASDRFTLGVAKMIGLPAGFVNGSRISYAEMMQDLQAVRESYKKAPAEQAALKPSDEQMRKNVWEMLVRNAVIRQQASKLNIVVSDKDVQDEYANLVQTVGSEEEAENLIKNNYGWNVAQFKQRILRPFILQQKLSLAPQIMEKLGKEPEQKAQEVLTKVQEGKQSFEDLAKEYGEDGSKDNGGDLGWFGKGMMVQEFESAVASMKPGEVKGLVQSQFGYHIIKLEEVRQNNEKESEWRARHILIKTGDFDTYLSDLVKQAKVWQWVSL